jgi:calcineurin-like phosphoesterase family protein
VRVYFSPLAVIRTGGMFRLRRHDLRGLVLLIAHAAPPRGGGRLSEGVDVKRMPMCARVVAVVVAVAAPMSVGVGGQTVPAAAATSDPVVLAAGDIASCSTTGDTATAALIKTRTGTVLPLGDLAKPHGTASEFTNCYGPTWGVFKSRTRPTTGNHEYDTAGASGYFNYFGALAGPRSTGYYSYNLGAWHVVALNSNCTKISGGCVAGSPEEKWLRADLAAHRTKCTLAYWHAPLFTSGADHTNATSMRPLFRALYDGGAEIVLSGHNHNYERFAPQTPTAVADSAKGVRQFVVGTGGVSHTGFATIQPNSEVRNATTFGVVMLTLHSASYDWKFLPVAGRTFTDSGTKACH